MDPIFYLEILMMDLALFRCGKSSVLLNEVPSSVAELHVRLNARGTRVETCTLH